jgi:predicted transposase/invertase (TIGR01784 family)
MASEHDKRYKKLFSYPGFMERLLNSFVDEEFVEDLDFSTLKRVDKSFISEIYKEKESDIIYTVQFKDHTIYIFLLLEFQSSVDKMMPVRFVRYITELYDSYQGKTESGRLPGVFPILLYNGDAEWTAPIQFSDCVENTLPKKYIPQFQYFPILINEIPKKSLERIKNALSAVFYIENSSVSEIADEIDNFFDLIKEENLEIVNLLSSWFNNYLQSLYDKIPKSSKIISDTEITRTFDSIMAGRNFVAWSEASLSGRNFVAARLCNLTCSAMHPKLLARAPWGGKKYVCYKDTRT